MIVYKLDPLTDSRWPEFLARHPKASIFHTREWLQALCRTYGYKPMVFSTSNGAELSNGVVFCQVQSWLTGKRLVSVPFSDHCQPLADGLDLEAILDYLDRSRRAEGWKYIELRPAVEAGIFKDHPHLGISDAFSCQTIELKSDLETIYRRFHESCVRRKIKRAERENLAYESGRSEQLLEKFRDLLLITRRRHKLPPQPVAWFRNLVECLGDKLTIHLLSKDGDPVASIITLSYKNLLIYKYGCSDARFHNLGGMFLLFWKVIQQYKQSGAEEFDLGRSAPEDPGLIAFKGHLGAVASELKYYRCPAPPMREVLSEPKMPWVRQALACLPKSVLTEAGRLLYRHLG
jgi:Acetyltransferase (GNAT) domain